MVRLARINRNQTMDEAARTGEVSHVTWRRIEVGEPVRERSYAAVDRVFGLDVGTTLWVINGNGRLDDYIDQAGQRRVEKTDKEEHFRRAREDAERGEPEESNSASEIEASTGRSTGSIPGGLGRQRLRQEQFTHAVELISQLDLDQLERLEDMVRVARALKIREMEREVGYEPFVVTAEQREAARQFAKEELDRLNREEGSRKILGVDSEDDE